jgi:putative transposase
MRFARAVVIGQPHHITQRGNYAQDVFLSDGDRMVYLEWLGECAARHGMRIWAYCLMTNHVHLLAVPEKGDSFARCLAQVHMRHSQRINRRTGQRGHLWQGRFYSCAVDERHAWAALRYIECNPLRAGAAERAESYRWSSAAAHCGLKKDALLSPCALPGVEIITDWGKWLSEGEDDEMVRRLRASTHTGRPCGSPAFVEAMELRLRRTLSARNPGRPRGHNQGQI